MNKKYQRDLTCRQAGVTHLLPILLVVVLIGVVGFFVFKNQKIELFEKMESKVRNEDVGTGKLRIATLPWEPFSYEEGVFGWVSGVYVEGM